MSCFARARFQLLGVLLLHAYVACDAWGQDVQRILDAFERRPALSGEEDTIKEPRGKAEPVLPVFHFQDGSKVVGNPRFDFLEVTTRYGLLRIPKSDLSQVRFCESPERSIEKKDSVRKRNDILDRLPGIQDECVTERMTVRGRVVSEEFAVATAYGDLQILRNDLTAIVFQPTGRITKKLQVLPSFQPPSNWLDTRIEVRSGSRIRLQAVGTVTVDGYGVTSGPAGTNQFSGRSTYGGFPMLALVGKIHKSGKPFLIGRGSTQRVKKDGRLYLSVVPFPYSPGGANGSYDVTLDVVRSP